MYSLNYQHLRYFWTVARHENLTRASAELRLTPQTVSSQLRDLEDGLGEKLFERKGRHLEITEIGRIVFRYAEEIFGLGQELQDVLRGLPGDRPMNIAIGVADVVPKLIARRLIDPVVHMQEPVHIVCREGSQEELLMELAMHKLDVVLADAPIPPTVKVRAYNHLLGKCGILFMATGKLARRLRKGFPGSLDGAPFLAPMRGTALRQDLDTWFDAQAISPTIVGEFEDSALLKVFGQKGIGYFAIPSVIEAEARRQYNVHRIGVADGLFEHFYAISVERRVLHPAVAAIYETSRSTVFA
jgi:LysR family transcriptional activator of nhaA